MSNTITCTVVVRGDGSRCGKPAVTTFQSLRGRETYAECQEHAAVVTGAECMVRRREAPVTAAALGLKTRTRRPWVLVADGAIVGYADAVTAAVRKRAARLGAIVIPVR